MFERARFRNTAGAGVLQDFDAYAVVPPARRNPWHFEIHFAERRHILRDTPEHSGDRYAAEIEVLLYDTHLDAWGSERTAVGYRRDDGVVVADPRHVEPFGFSRVAGVLDLDIRALPLTVRGGGPWTDVRIRLAEDTVLDAEARLVTVDAARRDSEIRGKHRVGGIDFAIVGVIAKHAAVDVRIVVQQQDRGASHWWVERRRPDVDADDAVVGRKSLVGELAALPLAILEVVVPAVGDANLGDVAPSARRRSEFGRM